MAVEPSHISIAKTFDRNGQEGQPLGACHIKLELFSRPEAFAQTEDELMSGDGCSPGPTCFTQAGRARLY